MPKFTVDDFKHKEQEDLYRLRPNIILGPFQNEKMTVTIFKKGKFAMRRITSSIASRQTFREAVSNAIDNVRRAMLDEDVDPGVITVDLQTQKDGNPIFTVTNGGHMPPFELHQELGVCVPQAIVGVFNVGTNYEDGKDGEPAENRLGGQNGIGSKATNLFSKWFEITIIDATTGQKYFQRFEDFKPTEPKIIPSKLKKNTFKIQYEPNDVLGKPNIYWCACDVVYAAVTSYNKVILTIDDEKFDLSNLQFKDILSFYPSSIAESNKSKSKKEDSDEGEDDDDDYEDKEEENEVDEGSKKSSESSRASPQEEAPKKKRGRGKRSLKKKPQIRERYDGPEFPQILLHWKDKEGNEVIVADVHKKFQFPKAQGWVNGLPCHQGIHIKEAEKVFMKAFKDKLSGIKEYAEKIETLKLPPKVIRNNILILVKVEVAKPRFGSGQIKDIFVSPKVDLSLFDSGKQNPMGKEPEKWGDWKMSRLMQAVKDHWKSEAEKKLSQTDGKKTKHVKSKHYAVKANWAGTDKSEQCILIGCEGDSAKKYGDKHRALHPNGNNTVGIFAFRGKVLNTLNASPDKLLENIEITQFKKVLGLQERLDYSLDENMKTLRYGKEFVIMADADDDGTHIKGLLLLFFYTRFRSLLERGYVTAFFSPVLRVLWQKETYRFYRFEAYLQWLKEDPTREKAKPKYFKGLASADDKDVTDDYKVGKKIRYKIDKHAEDYMTLAFNDEYADARKAWLAEATGKLEELTEDEQFLSDFIDDDLVTFFHKAIERAIPALDGFKDVQRKLAWALRNAKTSSRVNIQATRAIVDTKYHHGPQAIEKALLKMVQDFAGTNNLPLFTTDGQFGSRDDPKPPAARYPGTRISPIYEKIFPKIDEQLLKKKYEEGEEIEPEVLAPVIPLSLVNGSSGVGAGWSTFIPAHEPKAVCTNMERIIRGQKYISMIPWYKGYHGVITMTETGFKSQGILENRGKAWRVTELPLWFWTKDFKDHLESLLKPSKGEGDDGPQHLIPMITDFNQNNAKTDVIDYTIEGPTRATFEKLAKEEAKQNKTEYKPKEPLDDEEFYEKVFKLFKLESNHSMQNMVLLVDGRPQHFKTVEGIMRAFYDFRMPLYEKRYSYLTSDIENTINELKKKLIITRLFLEGKVSTKDDDLYEKLIEYSQLDAKDIKDFLEKNPISTITKIAKNTEKGVKKIEDDIAELTEKLTELKKKTPKDLWLDDLAKLKKAL